MTDGPVEHEKRPRSLKEAIPPAAAVALVYHLIVATGAIWLIFVGYKKNGFFADTVLSKAALIIGSAAIGGCLAASRLIVYAVRHSDYDHRRFLWQIATPLWSAAFAGIGVIVAQAGLIIVSQSWSAAEPQYTLSMMAFAFFVGLASETFVKKLISAAEAFFGERPDLRQPEDDRLVLKRSSEEGGQ